MKLWFILIISLLVISNQSCISTSEVKVNEKNTFPTVTGSNLHGDEITFPNGFEKKRTIAVVAFQRWQQELCDAWYEHIEAHMKSNPDTAYFEIPTISKMNGFMRWFIYNGMRGGIKDSNMRSQVVTLHIDKEPFKEALKIDTEETVFVYVIDSSGKVLGSVKGEYTPEKWQRILSSVGAQ